MADAFRDWMRTGKTLAKPDDALQKWIKQKRTVTLTCHKCGHTGKPRLYGTPKGTHIRADCEKCGKYIKFVSPKQIDPK